MADLDLGPAIEAAAQAIADHFSKGRTDAGLWVVFVASDGHNSLRGAGAIEVAPIAVRAAVEVLRPQIEQAALEAAADDLEKEIQLQSSWLWYELGETALEKLAKRLRDRAARVGSDTTGGRE